MKRRMQPLFRIIFIRVFCVAIFMVIVGMTIVAVILSQYVLEQLGKNRLDVLSQIASQNQVVKNVTARVTDELTEKIASRIAAGEAIQDIITIEMEKSQELFDAYGMNTSVDIVLTSSKQRFTTSRGIAKEPIRQLTASYWYINLAARNQDKTWNLRLLNVDDAQSSVLSYGRIIKNDSGRVVCVIMANTAQRMLYDNYQALTDKDNLIYIVDEKGTIISHTNPSLVGFSMYHMESQKEKLQQSGTSILKKRDGSYVVTQYYDHDTGWTIIEELKVNLILLSYKDILLQVTGIIFLFVLIAMLISYITSRKISQPLMALEVRMEQIHKENMEEIVEQNAYVEVNRLSKTFNEMIVRIRELIESVKIQERHKNAIEFDFLQAQINPHFLHNTLIGIKTLILTGKKERAQQMISALIALLKTPIHADGALRPLKCEIDYVRQYVTLMECRYAREFNLVCYVAQDLYDFLVPPMILQPIVENAIFHGLAMKEGEALLTIDAFKMPGKIVIQVSDNGDGMTAQQLDNIWKRTESNRGMNQVSMKNVRSRIQYIYGAGSNVEVESAVHEGTVVRIVMTPTERREQYEANDR